MRYLLTILIAGALLAGCATPTERAALMQQEVGEMMALYGPACEKLGYVRDTDPWRDCVLRMDARDAYRWRGYPAMTQCIEVPGGLHCTNY